MCGIAGYFGPGHRADEARAIVERMTTAIRHRGPDDAGHWLDADGGVALGHRRLSILDLSPAGHQPMHSVGGRFVIVFNGEVYNWKELRAEEERYGARFRGHSDTEVMLSMFERIGVLESTRRFAGMFAFALWDRERHELHLGRDRLGEKPLYYSRVGTSLLFGSELKALKAHPDFRGEIDRDSLALYTRFNYVPAPYSIYTNVRKVEPGTIVTVHATGTSAQVFWSLSDVVAGRARPVLEGTQEELLEGLEARLRATIAEEMLADVPLGAFLSGGIDSSLIVALMQAQSTRPVRTFTIGFNEAAFNEAEHAKAVAKHLGTDHTELYVTPEQARDVIPRLPAVYDEPMADSSQIPTFLVSELARQHVTVALSGDGGDEMFGGYSRYFVGRRIWSKLRLMPAWLRSAMAAGIRSVSPAAWERTALRVPSPLLRGLADAQWGDRMHKLAGVLSSPSAGAMYRRLISNWQHPEQIVRAGRERESFITSQVSPPQPEGSVEWMMFLDAATYLPDDIMVKVDRASMAVSLESRAPFLDHRVVEYAWGLPTEMKLRDGQGKWALRRILDRFVPRALTERPKVGFGVPIDQWLRGPLKEWADDLLGADRLSREGYFDPRPIRLAWDEHQSGRRNRQYELWNSLMFQSWLEQETTGATTTRSL